MKYIKTFEDKKMDLVNYKDLRAWDIKRTKNKNTKIGKKDFNINEAELILEFINKLGIGVDVSSGNYLANNYLLLVDEGTFEEWRVELTIKPDYDEFVYDYLIENELEEEELTDKQREVMDSEYNKLEWIDIDDGVEFSVFLPVEVGSKDEDTIRLCAIADGFEYFKILYKSFCKKGYIRELINDNGNSLRWETDKLKEYLKLRNIKITNDNLEVAVTADTRIYKDGKFFSNFGDLEKSKEIFNFLVSLIK